MVHSNEEKVDCKKPLNDKKEIFPSGKPITDSRYGIIVVLAALGTGWIIGVMFIAFSILYTEFKDHFDSSYSAIGWVGSLYLASGNILGIIFSVFIKRYGCRNVAVIGGLIWASGFAFCSVASSVYSLYITYGIIAGSGFNMVTLCSFVIVQQHFVKYRALAAGLAATGISLGSLSSGPIMKLLIDGYGWRGTFLIMASIVIQSSVLGALFRAPRTRRTANVIDVEADKEIQADEKIDLNEIHIENSKDPKSDKEIKETDVDCLTKEKDICTKSISNNTKFSEDTKVLPEKQNGLSKSSAFVDSKTVSKKCPNQALNLLKDTFNVKLFLNIPFALCCSSTFFMNFGGTVFFQHTPNRARYIGLSAYDAVLIPTAVGIATAIARAAGGAIGNLRCTSRTLQYGLTIAVAGVLMFFMGHAFSFVSIAVLGAAIGALIGLSLTVQTTVMTDLVGVDNIARAQAFVLLLSGVAALIAVPLAGLIVDKTTDYRYSFYLGGLMQIIGGCLTVVTFILQRTNKWRP